MALKDTWKDKVDGVDDVLAKDINSIAQSAIQSEEKIAKQETTINGKVDKITTPWKAYTTDANGNTVPKALAAKPADGGVVLYNAGGIVKTNAPVEDLDCVNKKTMDDGLAGKLDSKAQSLTGIWFYGIEGNKDGAKRGVTSPSAWNVPLYATNGVLYTNDPTLATSSEKEKACANVGYVDGKVSELEHGMMNALGTQYTFEYIPFIGPFASISENVLPFVYVEKLGNAIGHSSATGETTGTEQITYIEFRDAMGMPIGEIRKSDEGQFVKIPEGAKSICVLTDLSVDSITVDVLLKVQVKAGA